MGYYRYRFSAVTAQRKQEGIKLLVIGLNALNDIFLSFLYLVQIVLHLGGEAHVHELGEMVAQLGTDDVAQIGGREVLVFQPHVFAFLDGGNDGGVGGGAADAQLFQFAYQRGFGVARGGLGELLFLLQLLERDHLAFLERRQGAVFFIGALGHDGEEAREKLAFALGLPLARAAGERDRGVVEAGGGHLRGHEAAPDEIVQAELVGREEFLHVLRGKSDVDRADSFVGVLNVLLSFLINIWFCWIIFFTIIICDEIEDPHNLGAIIRTAETSGADGVIIPKRRSAGLNATVFKTSAGAASYVPVARVSNLVETINDLKKKNIWVYGAEADGQPFHKADLSGAVALVIGSEGFGLGRLVRESCDMILSIDMYGKVNSLNASVSGGILMYEVVRHRR